MSKPTIGLQLYTVRDALDQDYVGTLNRVRDIGYTHVELAGHGPYGAAELKKVLDDVGLVPACDHCVIDELESNIQGAIGDTLALGVKYLVCPWLPEERRTDEDAWKRCAESLATAGQACAEHGIVLCYHNHSFEFVKLGDRYALDLLYNETTPEQLQAELDTYWIKHGGEDPVAYINRYAGRCPILHLKDMADNAEQSFAEVGEGILDFPAILNAGETAGVAYAMVEQDICPGDPFDSIATSLANLRHMGYA